jgi:hypothetical protein
VSAQLPLLPPPRDVLADARAVAERHRAGGAVAAAGRGDVDNFAKAALDALVDAEVMTDDHLVSTLTVRKVYHGVSGVPFLAIEVRRESAWPTEAGIALVDGMGRAS